MHFVLFSAFLNAKYSITFDSILNHLYPHWMSPSFKNFFPRHILSYSKDFINFLNSKLSRAMW